MKQRAVLSSLDSELHSALLYIIFMYAIASKSYFSIKMAAACDAGGGRPACSLLNYTHGGFVFGAPSSSIIHSRQQMFEDINFTLPDGILSGICLFAMQQNRWRHRELLYLLKFERQRLRKTKRRHLISEWVRGRCARAESCSLCVSPARARPRTWFHSHQRLYSRSRLLVILLTF